MPEERERPAAETSELRAKILAASIALIEEQGLAKLSMREVARRAGVTHQAPYHYFADREAILGEIAAAGFRMLAESVQRALISEHGPRPAAAAGMETTARAYVEFALSHPAHFRIMFRPELVDLENCPHARAEGESAFCMLTRVVHEAVLEGLPAYPCESALVTMIWSVAHGLACLLLDGSLGAKLPKEARETHIRDVMSAFGAMLRAGANTDMRAASAKSTRTATRRPTPKRKLRA